MIDPETEMPEREALAAEYVLGTLPLPERLAAEALIEGDANFAVLVETWQNRLAPLNELYPDAPPPADHLARIEARLFPEPEPARSRFGFWTALLGAGLAAITLIAILWR